LKDNKGARVRSGELTHAHLTGVGADLREDRRDLRLEGLLERDARSRCHAPFVVVVNRLIDPNKKGISIKKEFEAASLEWLCIRERAQVGG
jgi:hypothetical protein